AHNGNLVNTEELLDLIAERHGTPRTGKIARGNTSDTALFTALLNTDATLSDALRELMPLLHGAYCFTLMTESTLYAARGAQGIRPLVLGRLGRGWVVASEPAALH